MHLDTIETIRSIEFLGGSEREKERKRKREGERERVQLFVE